MKTTAQFLGGLAVALFILWTRLGAQEVAHPAGEWQLIGETHAHHSDDHDAISVPEAFDDFRNIKFKVTDAPLNLLRLVITYDSGEPEDLPVRLNIAQGDESRIIDLRRGGRRVRKIEFWYDTKVFVQGEADVNVFGRK